MRLLLLLILLRLDFLVPTGRSSLESDPMRRLEEVWLLLRPFCLCDEGFDALSSGISSFLSADLLVGLECLVILAFFA